VPASQLLQAGEPAAEILPAGQSAQAVEPVAARYLPAAQAPEHWQLKVLPSPNPWRQK